MHLYYSKPGEVKFTIYNYIENILEYFLEDISLIVASPAGDRLFYFWSDED